MTPMEKIAAVGGRLWFQLYVWKRRDLSHQLIERAHRNGFEALIVTVDSPVGANREYNTHNGFGLPFNPTVRFTLDMMRHPAWTTGVLMKYFTSTGFPVTRTIRTNTRNRSSAASARATPCAPIHLPGTTSQSSATSGLAC